MVDSKYSCSAGPITSPSTIRSIKNVRHDLHYCSFELDRMQTEQVAVAKMFLEVFSDNSYDHLELEGQVG